MIFMSPEGVVPKMSTPNVFIMVSHHEGEDMVYCLTKQYPNTLSKLQAFMINSLNPFTELETVSLQTILMSEHECANNSI